ncbi:MAG TPA: hypothetical protein VGX37_07900 [Allosphingosinicella sp.]|jgi:hypothetical protein|nr:hypothetical protein [Allosphingosinicella sp.]
MPHPTRFSLGTAALAALLALGACGDGNDDNLAALDNELLANGADPALTSALEDQILVDPNLVQQAHPNSVRPPETPMQAQYPAGSAAETARAQGAGGAAGRPGVQRASAATGAAGAGGTCGAALEYGPQWANRLPAEFPAYPGAQVTEAAGTNTADCRMRIVTFRTGDAYGRVLDYYHGAATRAGFSAEHQVRGEDHLLGGVKEGTDGAFVVIVTPVQRGSEVALIVNNGR